jgi:hypothetical protein
MSDRMLCLKANSDKMYHLGIGHVVSVSTITRANETRSYLIYEDLANSLIQLLNNFTMMILNQKYWEMVMYSQ